MKTNLAFACLSNFLWTSINALFGLMWPSLFYLLRILLRRKKLGNGSWYTYLPLTFICKNKWSRQASAAVAVTRVIFVGALQ